eukprot:scaffold1042_cov401-Prasinococcus_capsulatus_cf.AAC.9
MMPARAELERPEDAPWRFFPSPRTLSAASSCSMVVTSGCAAQLAGERGPAAMRATAVSARRSPILIRHAQLLTPSPSQTGQAAAPRSAPPRVRPITAARCAPEGEPRWACRGGRSHRMSPTPSCERPFPCARGRW